MKKKITLFLLMICFLANAQIVNIPDANFKAKLLSASPSNGIASTEDPYINYGTGEFSVITNSHKIDTNNDGEIQISEALLIKYLKINSSNIVDLTGIEAFINLKHFECSFNQIQSLNISNLSSLHTLYCSSNQLTTLNLSGMTAFKRIKCDNNLLSSLDVSNLYNLRLLYCNNNQLNNLEFSNNTYLFDLNCKNNILTNINLSESTNLEYLNISNNQLSSLELTNNILLKAMGCYNNQIISLNINNLNELLSLLCNNNHLTSLDVSGAHKLKRLECNDNELISLNLKNGNSLWATSAFYANGNDLNFSNNTLLQYICSDIEDESMVMQKINDYSYTNCHVNSYCSFTPGGTFYEISGNTKLDLNNNGCDVSDVNYPNLIFSITDGTNTGSLIANQTGSYYIPVSAGNHTITPNLENPSYFNVSPTDFTVEFPTQTSPFTQDFCVTANGVKHDVEVVLIPTVPARPGFEATYKLVYHNKGNQIENGAVSLTFDDARLDYVSANPVYNSSVMNSFTWNYIHLQPFETREVEITFNVNSPMESPAVNNGDILNYTATITTSNTDETPTDNTFTLDQTVVGSYDPNDKTCLQGTTITQSEVGKYVHYVIRFENTGTFPAEKIVVKDMIDLTKFDIATLVPLKGSHEFYTRIKDNKVEFIFENINLDFNDATNDGYVAFKIKTKPTLVVGNTFTNNANIYFDYNFPITTNTYTTTVAALSTQDFDFGNYFSVYPNPAKDVLNIQTKQDLSVNSVEIYNQLGQIVLAVTNAVNTVDVANLASGTYFVKVNTDKGSANMKFVKE